MTFKRIAAGDYQTPDGRYLLRQVPGVLPPAWNVEDTRTNELLVDGAAGSVMSLSEGGTMQDAPSQIAAAKLLRYRITGVIVTPVSLRVRA